MTTSSDIDSERSQQLLSGKDDDTTSLDIT
jgi:hypothetical protein